MVGVMKFHTEVVFEFTARDVAEAGERLSALLEQAREATFETRSLELSTPRGVAVTLPHVVTAG
jgi:hypothetical protein